ncbi:hypothetical protein OAG76_04040 [Rubripirellula sp.]|nr:hypothetical protein [Rubripirellula sp.]MDB4634557.1 hypothetical protein [Rubripirellula sp.]
MSYSKTSVLFAPVLILVLLSPSLLGFDCLAFRDVAFFYTPLYDYVAERCSEAWLPLWNPLDQTGMPLIGETTTAVLYPLRYLIFSLPISTESAMAWYVAVHLIIASMAARLLARWAGCRPLGATIASLLYPLSGSVLFLYTNPPFLVGAAWLPLALGAMLLPQVGNRRFRITVAGSAMAMMILGGDPQSALHVMLVVSVVGLVRLAKRSRDRIDGFVLFGVPMLAAILSAPQLVASISWSQQSDRLQPVMSESWIDPPQFNGMRSQAFQYSLPPWHIAEIVTPNAFGSFIPINQRFSRLWAGDGRAWTPSIYMGVVAFLALWIRLRFRHERFCGPWLALCWMSLLLTLGHFGLVWLVQSGTGRLLDYDSAIGGPYWFLYQFLPGYDSFRYPTKWLPFFALAVTMVTAQMFDRLSDERHPAFASRVSASALWLAVVMICTVIGIQIYRWMFFDNLRLVQGTSDSWWGPINVLAGLSQLTTSLYHSIVVLLAISLILRFPGRCKERCKERCKGNRSHWATAAIVVVCLDLGISGSGMVHQVSNAEVNEAVLALTQPARTEQNRWMRTKTGAGWPAVWSQGSSDERLLEVEASSRVAWFGRWHLAARVHMLNNMVSIRSRHIAVFWQAINQLTSRLDVDEQVRLWRSLRGWLAIEGFVHASDRVDVVNVEGKELDLVDLSSRFQRQESDLNAYQTWEFSSKRLTPSVLIDRFQQAGFLIDGNGQRDPKRQTPVVQLVGDSQATVIDDLQAGKSGLDSNAFWKVKRLQQQPESAVYQVQAGTPLLITRPTIQDGNWHARFRSVEPDAVFFEFDRRSWRTVEVHGVDGITQGVILPSGQWWVEFYYQPTWLRWALIAFLIGWVATIICFVLGQKGRGATVPDAPVPAVDASC